MSLTNEQVSKLNQLNTLFRRFETQAQTTQFDDEEFMHQYATEEFPMVNAEREHLNKLSGLRKDILSGKQKGTTVHTVKSEGDTQLSFD